MTYFQISRVQPTEAEVVEAIETGAEAKAVAEVLPLWVLVHLTIQLRQVCNLPYSCLCHVLTIQLRQVCNLLYSCLCHVLTIQLRQVCNLPYSCQCHFQLRALATVNRTLRNLHISRGLLWLLRANMLCLTKPSSTKS